MGVITVSTVRITDSDTLINRNLPKGTVIFDESESKSFILNENVSSGKTINDIISDNPNHVTKSVNDMDSKFKSSEQIEVLSKIYSDYSVSILSGFTNHISTRQPTSTFNGWRYKMNYIEPFRSVKISFSCSKENFEVKGYIWDSDLNIISTSIIYTKNIGQSGETVNEYLFIFDKEINENILIDNYFWVGYKGTDSSTIIMDGQSSTTNNDNGLFDLTTATQYSIITQDYKYWVNNTGGVSARKAWIRFYNNKIVSIDTKVNVKVDDYLKEKNLDSIPELFKEEIRYTNLGTANSIIEPSFSTGASRGTPFCGWGADFYVTGDTYDLTNIEFNAIRLKNIRQTVSSDDEKWSYIRAFIKNEHNDTSYIAQTQLIELDSGITSISEVVMPIIDSDGNYLTLSGSSFSNNKYFIGYITYNIDNDAAPIGETKGSQSNWIQPSGGTKTSYYTTNTNWQTWAVFSSSPCVPIELMYADDIIDGTYLKELGPIEERLIDVEDAVDSSGITEIKNLFYDKFNYDDLSTMSGITVSFGSGYARNIVFCGWGADFYVTGGTFNAIRMKNLKRTGISSDSEKWHYIKAYIKNTSSSSETIATTIKVDVDPEIDTIEEIVLPLVDADDNLIELKQSDFENEKYFIGYIAYNKDGDKAAMGSTTGSQSNWVEPSGETKTSYYTTNTTWETWSTYSGSPCVPIEMIYATNLRYDKYLKELISVNEDIDDIEDRLDDLEGNGGDGFDSVRVILPDEYQAVVGDTLQLFYRGIVESVEPYYKYNIQINCDIGHTYYKYYEVTPISTNVGNHTLTFKIYDDRHNLLTTGSTILNVKNHVQQPSNQQTIICIGDSLTSGGYWVQELNRRLVLTGGTPAGHGYSNIEFIGSVGSGDVKWIGYGGKTWNWYNNETSPGDTDKWVYVSGGTHDKDSSDLLSYWEDSNNNNWKIEEIETTRIKFSASGHTSDMPTSSDTLTHVSGAAHTNDIKYTSVQDDGGNPLWDDVTNRVNYQAFCDRNGFNDVTTIYTLLTWNGQAANRATPSDHATMRSDVEEFLDNIHSDFSNAKVKILGMTLPSIYDGLGHNYGASGDGYSNYYGLVRTIMGMNLLYQEVANDSTYSSFVEYINVSGQFDNEHNYPYTSKSVNTRNSSETAVHQTNGVHPSTGGYYQIGDAAYRNFIKNYCQ